jgi:serine/threonine protein kinase
VELLGEVLPRTNSQAEPSRISFDSSVVEFDFMADSLFDGRYRYDYIYPRGRSGETLRAVDTQDKDRPVVIKRPAPNDAPPIRAGQEVSILNERKALTRLAGHPVLTALVGSGQFFVGGMPHQYIVMERGQGVILADAVLEVAAKGQRLPLLEMLVMVDNLLDLLHIAHARDIVYNDVDAKHLFWDRENYRLKVIDWGNAVFLEGDEVTPQGISRQSDIFQVGELLYFILTGGGRPEIPRDVGMNEDFQLDFGENTPQIPSRLQAMVSKAAHPNPRLRYKTIADLRKDLTDLRAPLERERDGIVGRVNERLRRSLSKNDLRGLLATLEPALASDPGNPPARQAYAQVMDRLRDLEVSADLDAVRIYMQSANWTRAADLLNQLREKAGSQTTRLINLLLDCTVLLLDANLHSPTAAIIEGLGMLFEGHFTQAAQVLLLHDSPDDQGRSLQWLLAERISAHIPEVILLRPNLYRLDVALAALTAEGLVVTEPRALLAEASHTLDSPPTSGGVNLAELRDRYRAVVDQLTALGALLEPISAQHNLTSRKLPMSSLERALNAVMALADNMHVIGRQATTSPRDALAALDSSRSIDPTNTLWDSIQRLLNGLYELLQSYQTHVPSADGTDLEAWLKGAQRDLAPFVERLFDDMLAGMVGGLQIAEKSWADYGAAVIAGNRVGALTALTEAIEAVGTVSPTLSGWLNQLRSVITGANYIERHAIYGGLGRALADGWEAFDRGRLSDAERLGQQAFEIAHSESARSTARRLRVLSQTMRDWCERNGVNNAQRTQAALVTLEELFTADENNLRNNFAAQMPSKDTYLRAMNKGLVELYTRSSTAASRILAMHYVLLGTLDTHEGRLEDAQFWREAAVRALGDYGPRHVATRALDEYIERRRDIGTAAGLLNQINSREALPLLESLRKQLEASPQAKALAAGVQSVRELEAALRDWSDGEFRSAGLKLENAINMVNELELSAEVTLTNYRAFLMNLQASAAELHHVSRQTRQIIERRPAAPADLVQEAHRRQVETTERVLGESYAATLRQWNDTYEAFLEVYTDSSLRRSAKLNHFNELFKAMFIDRHPAYPLYRHWYELTDSSPEFPAPPTGEPVPRLAEDEDILESDYRGSRYADEILQKPRRPMHIPRTAIFGGIGIVVLMVIIILTSGILNPSGGEVPVTISPTPNSNATGTAAALAALNTASTTTNSAVSAAPTSTLDPNRVTPTLPGGAFNTPTLIPSETPTLHATVPLEPSATPTVTLTNTPLPTFTPTNTNTPTITPTPTATFTPSNTPTATLPPNGLQGTQDLLDLFSRLPQFPWSSDQFSLTNTLNGAYWRLGVGSSDSPDATLYLPMPADLLETYYGNNAAARIRRTEATLSLLTFNPTLLDSKDVYFGLLLQSVDDPKRVAGIHVEVAQANVINLAQRSGDAVNYISQKSVNTVIVRIRLERDPSDGKVTVFYNDAQLGKPIDFLRPDAPVIPVLFVKNGGVIISVTGWKIALR